MTEGGDAFEDGFEEAAFLGGRVNGLGVEF
jgi:hypothetical protein